MATGIVSKVGERLSVNVKLIDIATVTARRVGSRKAASIEGLQDQMAPLVAELLGNKSQAESSNKDAVTEWTSNQRTFAFLGTITGVFGGIAVGLINEASYQPTLTRALVADALILGGFSFMVLSMRNVEGVPRLPRQHVMKIP